MDQSALPPIKGNSSRAEKRFKAVEWSEYFEKRKFVEIENDVFCVYEITDNNQTGEIHFPTLVLLHGAGFTGLTWAVFAKLLSEEFSIHIIAFDLRGHGLTQCQDETDFSIARLAEDVRRVCDSVIDKRRKGGVILCGHSMGGAVAAHVASADLLDNLSALIVVDVVESTAVRALGMMRGILAKRPERFATIPEALKWCSTSGYIRNSKSARVSMPSQLQERKSDDGSAYYVWRINLAITEKFWFDWFNGLSEKFLSTSAAKFLITAQPVTSDTALVTASMQGKYQLMLIPKSGHVIQEDQAQVLAEKVAYFLKRNFRFPPLTSKM